MRYSTYRFLNFHHIVNCVQPDDPLEDWAVQIELSAIAALQETGLCFENFLLQSGTKDWSVTPGVLIAQDSTCLELTYGQINLGVQSLLSSTGYRESAILLTAFDRLGTLTGLRGVNLHPLIDDTFGDNALDKQYCLALYQEGEWERVCQTILKRKPYYHCLS